MDTSRLAAAVLEAGSGAGTGLVVFLTALAVKLLDDLIDGDLASGPSGGWNPTPGRAGSTPGRVGPAAAAVYAAVLLMTAAAIRPAVVVALFMASYAVGMLSSPGEREPSGMRAWVESLVAVGVAALAAGPFTASAALLACLAVQAADDFVDLSDDRKGSRVSLAVALGRWGAVAVAGLAWGMAVALEPPLALAVAVAAVPPIAGWLSSESGRGGRRFERRAGPADRFRLAAAGIGTILVAAAASVLGAGTAAGAGAHVAAAGAAAATPGETVGGLGGLAVAVVLTAILGGGVVAAYHRGRSDRRRRRGTQAEALAALWRRVERLEED